jgi:hypothetical protein
MELREAVDRVRYELYRAEGFSDEERLEIPPPGTREYACYLDRLEEVAAKRTPECATEWRERLKSALEIFGRALPKSVPGFLSAPVRELLPNAGQLVERMAERFYGDPRLFQRLRQKIAQNAVRAGKGRPSQSDDPVGYFAGTPLRWLFDAQISLGFPDSRRFEGQWVVARRGAGKTNLLSCQILRDLDAVARGAACVVVIDVTGAQRGQIIHNVTHHKRFAPGGDLHGKLVYVDPTDADVIPINLMSMRVDTGDADAVSGVTANFIALMGGLMNQPLTGFQDPVFRAAVQLAMVMPNPTLATLRQIIQPRSEVYKPYLPKLRPQLREYFEHGFNVDGVVRSRGEILTRLHTLSMDAKFARLFEHSETRLDFSVELNKPQVIVINCDRNNLKSMTKLFGRFYFSLITQAAEGRAKMPRAKRLPTYIYFDEASEVIGDDPNAAFMMNKLRQMNVGLITGMQDTTQAAGEARRAYSSSLIKFVNADDESAKDLAGDMRCDDSRFLMNRPPGNFAYFLTGEMPSPIGVNVPRVVNDHGWISEPMMAEDEFDAVMVDIRKQFYISDAAEAPTQTHQSKSTDDLAALDPRAAVLVARARLEDVLREMVTSVLDSRPDMTFLMMIDALQQHQVIEPDMADTLHELRKLGNQAGHDGRTANLKKEAAIKYIEQVDQVIARLKPGDQQPRRRSRKYGE